MIFSLSPHQQQDYKMDSQGKDTELEITKIGVSNSGDNLRTDQKPNLRADQLAKKKLLEQTKKLSNKLKVLKNLKNPGLEGREFIFYIVLIVVCSIFLLYTIIQHVILLLQAQNNPASSLSYETSLTYPEIALLVCPHFLVNINAAQNGETLRVVPHLDVFQFNAGGSRTSKFTSSEGNKADGKSFPFIPYDPTNIDLTKVYEPTPIDMAFYQKTTIGCIMMTPSGINSTINSGTSDLRTSLDQISMDKDQDQIAQLTVGMFCMVSINGGEFIRKNEYCPDYTPLLVTAISIEDGDFNFNKDLIWNFQHPCNDSPAKYCACLVLLFFLFFFFLL